MQQRTVNVIVRRAKEIFEAEDIIGCKNELEDVADYIWQDRNHKDGYDEVMSAVRIAWNEFEAELDAAFANALVACGEDVDYVLNQMVAGRE